MHSSQHELAEKLIHVKRRQPSEQQGQYDPGQTDNAQLGGQNARYLHSTAPQLVHRFHFAVTQTQREHDHQDDDIYDLLILHFRNLGPYAPK